MSLFHRELFVPSAAPSFAVATLTGGVGKTTATRLIDYMWAEAGRPLTAASIDSVDDKRSSKLSKLIEGARQIEIEAAETDVAAAGKETDAQMEHWNRVGVMLGEGGCLLDFGANRPYSPGRGHSLLRASLDAGRARVRSARNAVGRFLDGGSALEGRGLA